MTRVIRSDAHEVSKKNTRSNRRRGSVKLTRLLTLLFLTFIFSSANASPAGPACPNGVFDNGKMYDAGNNLTNNTCATVGTSCTNVYFYGRAAFETAVCGTNSQWILVSTTKAPSTPSTPSTGTGGNPDPQAPAGAASPPIIDTPDDSKTVSGCPNGVFDNGKIYNASNTLTNNSCVGDGTSCPNVYFYGQAAFQSAVCSSGVWVVAGTTPKDPVNPGVDPNDDPGPIKVVDDEPKAVAGCPNGIFDDGQMYDANSNYVANTCSQEGQQCNSVYFYGVGKFEAAVCADGKWTNPVTKLICGGLAGDLCPDTLTCVDDPNDSCNPKSGGADCIGMCQPIVAQPECNFDDPNRDYAGKTAEICTRIAFQCDTGFQSFGNECGCGCERIDVVDKGGK